MRQIKTSWKWGIWREGPYFDLWNVNHFLAGFLPGCFVLIFDVNLWLGFIVTLILMVGWEIYELYANIHETKFNMIFDVVIGVIGFWLIIFLQNRYQLDSELISLFWQCLILYIFLELWGFRAYKIKEKIKQRLLRRAKRKTESIM